MEVWLALKTQKGANIMKKALFVFIPVLLIVEFFALPVVSADTLVRFKGGIGVIPVRGNAPPFTANLVLGVIPAGQPWVIRDLEARVKTNGEIKVKGEGLIRPETTSGRQVKIPYSPRSSVEMSPTTLVPSRLTLTETSESTMCSRRRHRIPVITLYCSSGTLRLAIGSLLGFRSTNDSLVTPE